MIKLAVLREIAMFSPRGLSGPTATKVRFGLSVNTFPGLTLPPFAILDRRGRRQ